MQQHRFMRVAVIGTGMMGPGIALAFAQAGCGVTLTGRSLDHIEAGMRRLDTALAFLTDHGLLAESDARAVRARVSGTVDLEAAVAGAGLVEECIAENLAAKQGLFGRLEHLCAEDTLLVSNTSGLRITDIVAGLAHPERTASVHFWNPPHIVPLVEVTQGAHTSEETIESLVTLLRLGNKTPIIVRKDVPGQVGNRLQHALLREALYLVQEGIASAADVDRALKLGPGRRWPVYGVLEHADVVGAELSLAVQRALLPDLCRATTPLPILAEMVAERRLGIATGAGFYDWSRRGASALQERRDAFLTMLARDWREPEAE